LLGAQAAELAPRERDDVAARDPDRARPDAAVAREVADSRERRRRLAAAGLADEAVRLAAADRERHAAQDLSVAAADAVDDVEVGQLDCGRVLAHRSSTFEMLSATRFRATTREAIASPGKSTVHQ